MGFLQVSGSVLREWERTWNVENRHVSKKKVGYEIDVLLFPFHFEMHVFLVDVHDTCIPRSTEYIIARLDLNCFWSTSSSMYYCHCMIQLYVHWYCTYIRVFRVREKKNESPNCPQMSLDMRIEVVCMYITTYVVEKPLAEVLALSGILVCYFICTYMYI